MFFVPSKSQVKGKYKLNNERVYASWLLVKDPNVTDNDDDIHNIINDGKKCTAGEILTGFLAEKTDLNNLFY